jgi:hypothetical protein
MRPVSSAIGEGVVPTQLAARLREADDQSFAVVKQIAASGTLIANHPAENTDLPKCVCLSECSLPGLIGLSERFGRFGFVFRKQQLFAAGARPCAYLADDEYALIASHKNDPEGSAGRHLWGLSNILRPPSFGQVQDYTHDREWRYFGDLSLTVVSPEALIVPQRYLNEMPDQLPAPKFLIPLDLLFEWGA